MKSSISVFALSAMAITLATTGSFACQSLEKDLQEFQGDTDVTIVDVFQEPHQMIAAVATLPSFYRRTKRLVVRERELMPLDALAIFEIAADEVLPGVEARFIVFPYFHGQCRGPEVSHLALKKDDADALARAIRRFD